MDISLDTTSTNYDRSKGELISVNVDGAPSTSSSVNKPVFDSNTMDRLKLISSTMVTGDNRLVAGVIHNSK